MNIMMSEIFYNIDINDNNNNNDHDNNSVTDNILIIL